MAIIVNPTLRVQLSGDSVNTFTKSITWTAGEYLEKKINIVDTDSLVSMDYTLIDNVEAVIFQSDDTFIITMTAGGVTSTIEVTGLYLFTPSSTFWDTVTDISISTSSLIAISVDTRIYGSAS